MDKTILILLGILVGSALAFFPESENRVVAEPNIESNNDVRLVELERRFTELESRIESLENPEDVESPSQDPLCLELKLRIEAIESRQNDIVVEPDQEHEEEMDVCNDSTCSPGKRKESQRVIQRLFRRFK